MTTIQVNGLGYAVEERGRGAPIILLHGFTGSAASWSNVAESLAESHRVVAVDILGHGRSDAPRDFARYEFMRVVDDLAALSANLESAPATWIGYSMGGRLALALALQHPRLVSSLVLESASPGIHDAAERSRRRAADDLLARGIEERGVADFVAAWERLPMWDSQRTVTSALLERQRSIRLGQRATGLANCLRGMGRGAQPSLWERLPELRIPTLLLAGGKDERYVDIAASMAELLPRATMCVVPEAGHAIHLEQPGRFIELITDFVNCGNNVAESPQERR